MSTRIVRDKKLSAEGIRDQARLALALRLRISGKRFDEVAETCGYGSPQMARDAVNRILTIMVRQPAEELRQIETMRLEQMHDELWLLFMNRDNKILDRLAVVDRLVRISERRSKLLGLDMPSEVDTYDFAYRLAKKHGKSDQEADEIAGEAVRIANEGARASHFQLTNGQPEVEVLDADNL